MSVVHQSDAMKAIGEDDVIPLYCIVSNHSSGVQYSWDNIRGPVGVNSPVLYVSQPGTYRCTVTEDEGDTCFSKSIVVVCKGNKTSVHILQKDSSLYFTMVLLMYLVHRYVVQNFYHKS